MKTYLDPVCGMTVGETSLKADGFDDVAFCGSGCRSAFLADPSAYSSEPAAPTDDETQNGDNDNDQ